MMRAFLRTVDEFLRGQGRFALDAPLAGRLRWLVAFVVTGGLVYGAVMGSFSALAPPGTPPTSSSRIRPVSAPPSA